jgi:hypothetical protein
MMGGIGHREVISDCGLKGEESEVRSQELESKREGRNSGRVE